MVRQYAWLFVLGGSLLLWASCKSQPLASSEFRPTASLREVMHAVVEPDAFVIWDAVSETISFTGSELVAPETEDEWDEVRHSAIALREATNLLLIEGRHVAQPGETSAEPGIELEPEQIEALIVEDWQSWIAHVHALHDATGAVFTAIDAKDAAALSAAGSDIQEACENCHLKYWYPETPELQ